MKQGIGLQRVGAIAVREEGVEKIVGVVLSAISVPANPLVVFACTGDRLALDVSELTADIGVQEFVDEAGEETDEFRAASGLDGHESCKNREKE